MLRPHAVPHFARHPNHVFQQDNACAHTARLTRDFLQQHNFRTLPWPALSPDLNLIEHLWDEIQRRLNDIRPRPITAAELAAAFQRVWDTVLMAFINRLIHSMYRRCMSVTTLMTATHTTDFNPEGQLNLGNYVHSAHSTPNAQNRAKVSI